MSSPNPEQLNQLLEAARHFDWRDGERRLRAALKRVARSEKPARDGLPKVTMGGPGNRNDISDPTGSQALQRPTQDPLVTYATRAVVALKDAVDATDRFSGALAQIDRLAVAEDVPGCSVLAPYGRWEEVFRDGLGRWAYEYRRRNERLPSRVEIELHLEGGRVR